MQGVSRRRFICKSVAVTAGLGLPCALLSQPASTSASTEEIAPGLTLLRGTANGIALSSDDGAILIDAPTPGGDVAAALYRNARMLFNTNWRAEHTQANDALGAAGVQILAHENTRLWMTNDFTVRWEDRRYTPRAATALPNDTFYKGGSVELGGERIDYGHLPRAHTDGDVWVFFRRANILMVSDLLAVDSFPIIDYSTGGWIGGFREATRALLELADDATLIIPAVGQPQRRQALEAQLELCDTTYDVVGQAYVNAHSLDELIASRPLASWEAERGSPDLFLELAYRSAWAYLRAMGLGVV
jgi:glyoxylase-like metal-dependent hydrolase (beta-lactamase superfamily II)